MLISYPVVVIWVFRAYAKVFQQGNGADDSTPSTARRLNAVGVVLR